MLNEIDKNNLKYLPTTHTLHTGNPNLNPTSFINLNDKVIYCYFTNMKETTQSYIVVPNHLLDLYPTATAVGFVSATITDINVRRLYSNSGRNSLFDINTCYEGIYHDTEIQGISEIDVANDPEVTSGLPGGAICVTVPKYSIGYFKISFNTTPPKEGLTDYTDFFEVIPNPTAASIKIKNTLGIDDDCMYKVTISTVSGYACIKKEIIGNEPIDVSELPSGMYFVNINCNNKFNCIKKLIKIE